ncbi:predicted protein [Chaetoceros tenuissimus]|uniref:Uncharacterized protein n=1 Tax=Chaetoceros tenuissimus TaxID=426638 RepID=A0AAD3HB89_9STRA|nr:predicted protein [Chaetoceros tenuissimus]
MYSRFDENHKNTSFSSTAEDEFASVKRRSESRFLQSGEAFFCPQPNEEPIVVNDSSNSSFAVQIHITSEDALCLLLRVSSVDETKSIESFSRTSKTDDFNMIPVARSYNSFPWERLAGAYQDLTKIENLY